MLPAPVTEQGGIEGVKLRGIPLGVLLTALVLGTLWLAVPQAARAEVGDISVGGVWVTRLTHGAAGLTLEQRVRLVNQRITEVLSIPELQRRQIPIEVRPDGANAAIVVADIVVITVTPQDAAGTKISVTELARQWAGRMAEGVRRALPGREVIARMYSGPSSATLEGGVWYWRRTLLSNDATYQPADPRRYTLEFLPQGQLVVRADCNRGRGTYRITEGRKIAMSVTVMTRAACPPGSLDQRFLLHLSQASGYLFSGGALIIELKFDTGVMRFSRM